MDSNTRILKIPIRSGKTTCFAARNKPCEFVGTLRLGTEFVCRLFPDDETSCVPLSESAEGWLLRCPACLAAEEAPRGEYHDPAIVYQRTASTGEVLCSHPCRCGAIVDVTGDHMRDCAGHPDHYCHAAPAAEEAPRGE